MEENHTQGTSGLFGEEAPSAVENPLVLQLKNSLKTLPCRPDIYRKIDKNAPEFADISVPDWFELRRRRELELLQQFGTTNGARVELRPLTKAIKTHKGKGNGRAYTSRYRGVHQTFPTRRWEAQFRRNGKPTSLGCFDHEEEAARAYDKMMLWCEIHNAAGVKGGVTNFDPSDYEADVHWLHQVSQDELVQILRSDGRRQAAQRMMRQRQKEPQTQGVGPAAGMAAMKEREKEVAAAEVALAVAVGAASGQHQYTSQQYGSGGYTSAGPSTGPYSLEQE